MLQNVIFHYPTRGYPTTRLLSSLPYPTLPETEKPLPVRACPWANTISCCKIVRKVINLQSWYRRGIGAFLKDSPSYTTENYIQLVEANIVGHIWINSQSLEDTQVGYTSHLYTLDKYTLEKYTSSIWAFIYIFEHLSLHIPFRAFKTSYTFSRI